MFRLKIIDKPEMFKMKCNFEFPKIPIENLQEKEVDPTTEKQEIVADKEYSALSKVIVNPIPDEYIIPSGEIKITANGNYNVTDKASAKVNVPEKQLGAKTITKNGTYKATDDNLDGYSQVEVETSGVDINNYYVMTSQYSSFNYYIKKIPKIKIGSSMNYLFSNMANLQETDSLDTSLVSNANSAFSGCQSLKKLQQLNFLKCVALSNIFNNCYNFETFGGLLNLGEAYSTTASENNNSYTLNLSSCTKLTHDSLMNVINGLYDIATKGVKTQKLVLGSTNLAKLTAEEIAIATNKGWTVS